MEKLYAEVDVIAYNDGVKQRHLGEHLSKNPYSEESEYVLWKSWNAGWIDTDIDI